MKPFFCTVAAQQAGESIAGTASHYQTYVLIEFPTPWAPKVFSSEGIPASLRQFIKSIKALRSVQFLCIDRGVADTSEETTVIVYERSESSFCAGYDGYEFQVEGIDQVLSGLQSYWLGAAEAIPITRAKDILICTHGMRDKCCARFGKPFYREAKQLAAIGKLPDARIWKVSHIGGHRFAPTAIAFPDGRYYGRLTLDALQAIVNRDGGILQLRPTYRGWGILPAPLQVLERSLMLSEGWDWFGYRVSYQLLTPPDETKIVKAEIAVKKSSKLVEIYRATIVRAPAQVYCIKASCEAASPTVLVKYAVASCEKLSSQQPRCALATEPS